jgi:hypothetical protein
MLHLLYILAFTTLAFLAVGNLIRNMMILGSDTQRQKPQGMTGGRSNRPQSFPHPELLDERGNVINEPFLVMRSISVDDARERLDALFNSSPGGNPAPSLNDEAHDEANRD